MKEAKRRTEDLGVGFGVLEEREEVLAALGGVAHLAAAVVLMHLTLSLAANARHIAAEGNGLLVLNDIGQVRLRVAKRAALERHRRLTRVLRILVTLKAKERDGHMRNKNLARAQEYSDMALSNTSKGKRAK